MRARTVFVAFDDAVFDTAEACKAHEAAHVETRLVGLTIEQVRAALSREDAELADAVEEIGNRIAKARREAGDFRRGRKAQPEAEGAKSPEREAEECGRTTFRCDGPRNPPAYHDDALVKAWELGYDYERAAAARAA